LVDLAAETVEALEHLVSDGVAVWVGLDLGEHHFVLLPVVLELGIVPDDQVNDVQVPQAKNEFKHVTEVKV
jgi:hypothetical protein